MFIVDLVFKPYYFNSHGEVAYDPSSTNDDNINAEFQVSYASTLYSNHFMLWADTSYLFL
jgi:hypothetical protein